jgi:hypothetical protein
MCYVCSVSVEQALATNEMSLIRSCNALLGNEGDHLCRELETFLGKDFLVKKTSEDNDPRSICEMLNVCLPYVDYSTLSTIGGSSSSALDIRVSKAYGSKGYDKIRLSVISTDAPVASELFTYSKQFQYRWTNFYLNTGIVTVAPGQISSFTIGEEIIDIFIPLENSPVRGAIFADPCFSNEFVWCTYGEKFNMLNRSTELLNAINSHQDNNFWMILGDNFYDQSGEPTAQWFSKLSQQTKSKVYAAVPGNQ